MVFNSHFFIFIFLPLLFGIYAIFHKKLKELIILVFSLLFYAAAGIEGLLVLLLLTIVNYVLGTLISLSNSIGYRKLYVTVGVVLDIGLLFYYKYTNFAINIANSYFSTSFNLLEVVMPLGVSFFVFSMISYLIDIYRKEENCSVHEFLLYILFFPKIISGPIVQYKDFIKEKSNCSFSIDNFSIGMERFIIGLVKKVVIADILGATVDSIFGALNYGIDVPTAWLGALCYTIQIYFDFSGYSDMAIGIARMLGYTIKENFNFPYISKSITEFWRRWHISLGSWFREYLYIPLGGNRRGNVYVNLFIVFLATGIWHGASFNFIVWGCGIGIVMMIERKLMKISLYGKIPSILKWLITIIIINFGWVIFRSAGLLEGVLYLKRMFGLASPEVIQFTFKYYFTNSVAVTLGIGIVGSLVLGLPQIQNFWNTKTNEDTRLYVIKVTLLAVLFVLGIVYMMNSSYSPFIYFQF